MEIPQPVVMQAMDRAVQLASRGPRHNVNPQVGCVIVDSVGRIIAEGWHRGAGSDHAEVDALKQLRFNTRPPHELTAVVTLEPCNHTGRTGPCAQALIEAGVGKVIYGAHDPGDHSGNGAQTLLESGISAEYFPSHPGSLQLLNDWLNQHRSTVTLKWAQTTDARLAANDGTSQWITGPQARQHVHQQRAQADVIVTGTGTVLSDNPRLTARDANNELLVSADQQPIPVVIGCRVLPENAGVMKHPRLAHENLSEPYRFTGFDLEADMQHIRGLGTKIFIEAGPQLTNSLLAKNLVDELLVYLAPTLLGGNQLATSDLHIATLKQRKDFEFGSVQRLGNDLMVRGKLKGQH